VSDPGGGREVVRVCARQRQADEGALALRSLGIEASVRRGREGWLLETRAGESAWFEAGSARASRMVALGEWWRALTALTLHADLGHALGNVLAGALFGGSVCARLGTGVGAALLLAAGGLGNVANALYHRAGGHDSVGASTAVFAAVGILAADVLGARRLPRGGRLAPLGAAFGLFAMLGTSERADYGAHLFGLAAGLALGLLVARPLPAPPPQRAQLLWGSLAGAALAGAWSLALGTSGTFY
jgi:membrane associated rhomboid family serine protease